MIRILTRTALAASLTVSLASAGVCLPNDLDAAHRALQDALRANGVTVRTVTRDAGGHCEYAEGFYVSKDLVVGICVDREQRAFTADNLDTLRHEAIHVAQDCRGFRLGDGALRPGREIEDSYQLAGLNSFNIDRHLTPYVRLGAGPMVLALEAEAITGAALRSAWDIAAEVSSVCGA
ncbi:MAG: hypothetical protein CL959_01355 [Euryarchaeota archaeon]|nr:hypothetical protein [Euryarchaeota archaeon]